MSGNKNAVAAQSSDLSANIIFLSSDGVSTNSNGDKFAFSIRQKQNEVLPNSWHDKRRTFDSNENSKPIYSGHDKTPISIIKSSDNLFRTTFPNRTAFASVSTKAFAKKSFPKCVPPNAVDIETGKNHKRSTKMASHGWSFVQDRDSRGDIVVKQKKLYVSKIPMPIEGSKVPTRLILH
jgi:hypothetical protein